MNLTIKEALLKGIEAHKAGKISEADQYYTAILKANPNHPDANHNMGVLAVGLKKVKQSLPFFKAALKANNSVKQFWLSYIDALITLGNFKDAKNALSEALEIGIEGESLERFTEHFKSSFNDHSKVLPILHSFEEYDQAKIFNKKNTTQEPSNKNLQPVFKNYNKGKFRETLAELNHLRINYPNSLRLYNMIGTSHTALGNFNEAIKAYIKALSINPNHTLTFQNIAKFLTHYCLDQPDKKIHEIIITLLDLKTYVKPREIAQNVINQINLEIYSSEKLDLYSENHNTNSLEKIILKLSKLPLLHKFMSLNPIPNLKIELLLTAMRENILFSRTQIKSSAEFLKFQSVLALHCFTNEYIFFEKEIETAAIRELEISISSILKNKEQPSAQSILSLASYRALNQYEWSDKIEVSNEIKEVYSRQILEPKQEKILKLGIPNLKKISDKVSSNVRQQYEFNPYPRWVQTGLNPSPVSIDRVIKHLNLKLFDYAINNVDSPNILIAGCGTGEHSIGTAARYKNSRVLAIDLSLSSLAYAKRKTEELKLSNIKYMQADILDLKKLNRKFDIIESSGVLHHMDDPLSGWRVLTHCLQKGGLMKIGLYSELARQNIIQIRKEIKNYEIKWTDEKIRSFRKKLFNSSDELYMGIKSFSDFYSMSELKDLLFHVKEKRFTIDQIQKNLSELNLKFCGFDTVKIVENFKMTNTQTNDLYDLNKWKTYEKINPRTFSSMYQFWCQKIS